MDEEMRQFMAMINTKLDDILDRLSRDREDIESNRGHIVFVLEDSLTLSKRITKLEEEIRRERKDRPA